MKPNLEEVIQLVKGAFSRFENDRIGNGALSTREDGVRDMQDQINEMYDHLMVFKQS